MREYDDNKKPTYDSIGLILKQPAYSVGNSGNDEQTDCMKYQHDSSFKLTFVWS